MRLLHAASLSLLLLLGAACRSSTSPASGPTTSEARALCPPMECPTSAIRDQPSAFTTPSRSDTKSSVA